MSIKSTGGVFGRNPTFNDVTVESLTVAGNALPDASTLLVDSDIGSTVQGYDADTAKLDVAQTFTDAQQIDKASAVALIANRTTDQGDIVEIQYDGSKVGTIGRKGGALYLSDIDGTGFRFESNAILMTDGDGDKAAARYSLGLGAYPIGSIFQGSGHGIYMNGGTSAANLFDDYEEGAWTPVLVGSTSAGTATFVSGPSGTYTKIGNQVTVYFSWNISAHTGTGALRVNGLPFAESSPGVGAVMDGNYTYPASRTKLAPFSVGAVIRFYGVGSAVGYEENTLDTSHQMNGTLTYTV